MSQKPVREKFGGNVHTLYVSINTSFAEFLWHSQE